MTAVFVALTPGFGSILLENGPALRRFLRQVLTNGIPVVFAVNYLSFFLYAAAAERQGTLSSPILIVDLPSRICVFLVLHGVIYFVSADWFGSFGGDRWVSLACSRPDPRTISGVREHFRSLPLRNNDQRGTAVSKHDLSASCRGWTNVRYRAVRSGNPADHFPVDWLNTMLHA